MRNLKVFLLVISGLLIYSPPAPAILGDAMGYSPYWNWKLIETSHFRIVFPIELEPIAQKVARYSEEAHELLSPVFRWTPRTKTDMVVIDNVDSANGLTTPTLRMGITLFVTPPDNWSGLSDYDDWLRLLIRHEYTHLLNLDTTHGWITGTVRTIFGDAMLPNILWNRWMTEGMAVYMETRYTKSGRGRSSEYEGMLRAFIESGRFDRPSPQKISIDRMGGNFPYFPQGNLDYFMGYQLMNQISKDFRNKPKRSADNEEQVASGEDALGILSYRSGRRIPLFVNGNLENISGKNWFQYWDEWLNESQVRVEADLKKIKSAPLTQTEAVLKNSLRPISVAYSPDGRWMAYRYGTLDEDEYLYLKDLKTGAIRRTEETSGGMSMAFTPDSKAIFFSNIRKQGMYYHFSEIGVYDIARDSLRWLDGTYRAKDPDVSRDGKRLVFTITEAGKTSLAIAPILYSDERYSLGKVQKVLDVPLFDAVFLPKFSLDGRKVFYSIHRNGKVGEDLMELDLSTLKPRTLISDGRLNRFPTVTPQGELLFVSDKSGTNNIYKFKEGQLPDALSNVTTSLLTPVSAPSGTYANRLTGYGWNWEKVELTSSQPASIDPPPAPESAEKLTTPAGTSSAALPVDGYNIFPNFWPRYWMPLGTINPLGAGGQLSGFDTIDRHRYFFSGFYRFDVKKPDFTGIYYNRSWGPTFSFLAAESTSGYLPDDQSYFRKWQAAFSASLPITWTRSSLTPILTARVEQVQYFGTDPTRISLYPTTKQVPNFDLRLILSTAKNSPLAIGSERGFTTEVGGRVYQDGDTQIWKAALSYSQYIRVVDHAVLTPNIKAGFASVLDFSYLDSAMVVKNRQYQSFDPLNPGLFGVNSPLDEINTRGYPGLATVSRYVGQASADFRFPLARFYTGPGTFPLYLKTLTGFTFGEVTHFPSTHLTLPAVGAGVKLSLRAFGYFDGDISLEFHDGLNQDFGGQYQYLVFFTFAGLAL